MQVQIVHDTFKARGDWLHFVWMVDSNAVPGGRREQTHWYCVGGALGAVARYGLSELVRALWPSHFPLGTMFVNITGCFIVGLYLTLNNEKFVEWQFIVVVGFLGAYTTFSTFEYDNPELLRSGRFASAALNITMSVALGLIAVWLGVLTGRRIPS